MPFCSENCLDATLKQRNFFILFQVTSLAGSILGASSVAAESESGQRICSGLDMAFSFLSVLGMIFISRFFYKSHNQLTEISLLRSQINDHDRTDEDSGSAELTKIFRKLYFQKITTTPEKISAIVTGLLPFIVDAIVLSKNNAPSTAEMLGVVIVPSVAALFSLIHHFLYYFRADTICPSKHMKSMG